LSVLWSYQGDIQLSFKLVRPLATKLWSFHPFRQSRTSCNLFGLLGTKLGRWSIQ